MWVTEQVSLRSCFYLLFAAIPLGGVDRPLSPPTLVLSRGSLDSERQANHWMLEKGSFQGSLLCVCWVHLHGTTARLTATLPAVGPPGREGSVSPQGPAGSAHLSPQLHPARPQPQLVNLQSTRPGPNAGLCPQRNPADGHRQHTTDVNPQNTR